jgi:alkanesulfonate monooxygenase SsuD/methylene tetrahydromethanopterin reductase-like flavin-dependent oxidoreductase (luciferase family)
MNDALQVGVLLPPLGTEAVGSDVAAYARHAEQCGIGSLWVGDDLIATRPVLDSTLLLAGAATATDHIKLGFGVLIAALRPVAWVGKQAATLQHISGDRVLLGVGVGGEMHGQEQWRAAGVPFAERGQRTDRALNLLPGLVTGQPTSIDGGEPVQLSPAATMPPLLVGGGRVGLRRAIRVGADWHPPVSTPRQVTDAAHQAGALADRHGQPSPRLIIGSSAGLGDIPEAAIEQTIRGMIHYGLDETEARQAPITGSPEQAAEHLSRLADAGAHAAIIGLFGGDWFEQCEQLGHAVASLP